MNASDVADQAVRQVDKLIRNNERFARENWSGKVILFILSFLSLYASTSALITVTSNVS